ncbi:MAG: amidohydrolase [Firmicutes bacterium]|nr:amidohydrolase [Bacillota bacterium]
MKLLIKGCAIIPMTGKGNIIHRGDLAIEGNRILALGPAGELDHNGQLPANWRPDRTFDGTGKVALPGLVNTHTHAAMTYFRGYADDLELMPWLQEKIWPAEERLTAEDIYWGALLAIVEMLKSGTTCFADMYMFMEQVAQAAEVSGIRASLARGMIGLGPDADRKLDEASEFVQAWEGKVEGRITTKLGPHAPHTCPPAFLEKVMARADELGVGLHIHLAETRTEVEDVRATYGETPVKLMEKIGLFNRPVLAAHCVHLTDEEIEILVRNAVGIAHNPESNMKLASGVAPIAKLLRAGAIVGLGTDSAASNNNLDLLQEMRSASFLQKVTTQDPTTLPAYQVLEMATCGGARALGLERDIGCLVPGYKADLILVDLEKPHLYPCYDLTAQLVYSALASDVHTVIVDGKIVVENGKVLSLDEREIMREVARRAPRLVNRRN